LLDVPTTETFVPDRPGQFPIMSLQAFAEFGFSEADRESQKDNAQFLLANFFHEKENRVKILDPNDPKKVSEKQRKQLTDQLYVLFGSPAAPRVTGITNVVQADDSKATVEQFVEALQLDHKVLARGSKLYRIHCLHCHGLTGDGRGPTAPWVNPH